MVAWNTRKSSVAVVGGVRTPFAKMGTALREMHVTELARSAMQETLYRVGCRADQIDEVIMGNVVLPADAANPARVAAMRAGVPASVPALTVQRNCASGMEAVGQGAAQIRGGRSKLILAAGAESMSNIPLLFPQEAMTPFGAMLKAKTVKQKLGAAATFRPRHFAPKSALEQGLTDPLCRMIMGKTAEVLAHEFGITRAEQDEFALESHRRASEAIAAGRFDEQLIAVYPGKKPKAVSTDVGPRAEQSIASLAKLRPLFDKRDGSVTVGNACQVTDGAAALLLEEGALAKAQGREPLGYIRGYATAGLDPHRMGLGPVYAIDRLLAASKLDLSDIGLFEINEAFAAQVIACTRAMASDTFCRERLGRASALGEIDPDRLNVCGGAIALGHPVGATGARIVLNLLHDMRRLDVKFGVAALCVAGGLGAAILLERS